MACAVENYQPIFHVQCPYSMEDPLFVEATWLQTDIYNDLKLVQSPAAVPVVYNCPPKARTVSAIAPEARAPAWWESELASSVHKTLKKKEASLGNIELKSPQLPFRTEIVDFITAVCRNLQISAGTRHTAVRLMDYFMDGHNVMYYRLRLVALTCLLIAAKFEERDDCIPTIDSLQYSSKLVDCSLSFTTQDIVTLELYALKYFKWNISRPGVAHFIDYYQHVSLNTSSSITEQCTKQRNILIEKQVQDFSNCFVETALRDKQFLCYDPSKVAAAVVCVVRICARMERIWTPELQNASSYSLEDLQPLANILLRLYEEFQR